MFKINDALGMRWKEGGIHRKGREDDDEDEDEEEEGSGRHNSVCLWNVLEDLIEFPRSNATIVEGEGSHEPERR